MENKDIYILGVGHNTIVYIDLVEACGYKVAGLYHYNEERVGEQVHGYTIIDSNINLFKNNSLENINFAISVGDNKVRRNLSEEIIKRKGKLPTLIHPTAVVSRFATIEESVVIHAKVIVQGDAFVGKYSVLSYNSSISHNSIIMDSCYIASNAIIGAYVRIEKEVLVGVGAIVVTGKVKYIGANSVVGAGSVVINNVEPLSVVAGNPSRIIRK